MDRRERFESVEESLLGAFEGQQANLWTAMPGVVLAFNPSAMTVDVQPTVMAKIKNPEGVFYDLALPVLQAVPVCFPGGGGFTLTFPVKAGDECLLIIASRCIDMWWYYGLVPNTYAQPQNDPRMHNLSDALAIIGVRNKTRALNPAVVTAGVQLRSDDETMYVQITSTEIRLKHPTKVFIDAPATEVTGTQQTDQATTLETTLDVKGASTFENTIDVKSDSLLEGNLVVNKVAHVVQNLQVDSNGQFNGTLNSTGHLSEAGSEVWSRATLTSAAQIGGVTSLPGAGFGLNYNGNYNLNVGYIAVGTYVLMRYTSFGAPFAAGQTGISGSNFGLGGTYTCMSNYGVPAAIGCCNPGYVQLFQRTA
jgi:hypothetical protein